VCLILDSVKLGVGAPMTADPHPNDGGSNRRPVRAGTQVGPPLLRDLVSTR
jgi:hypothetical protein